MGAIKTPSPVKFIVGCITSDKSNISRVLESYIQAYGPSDLNSGFIPFDHTDYYRKEMGDNLFRIFYSFDKLLKPEQLWEHKIFSDRLEKATMTTCGQRTVNIDPGYITHAKLILLSTKNFQHRIYVGKGIYAEVTLRCSKNGFFDFEWTFPDYKTEPYKAFFVQVRNRYITQLKEKE